MIKFLQGDCLDVLPTLDAESVQCCVTSPPYWGLRDYGCGGQLGLEATPTEYVDNMVRVFREVWRVLKDDGTLWVNMGDIYAGAASGQNGQNKTLDGGIPHSRKREPDRSLKPKNLCMMPARFAMALQADGWYLRSDIIWHKPNPMPESVTDRPTKSHEYIFLLSKRERYFYDAEAIREKEVKGWAGSRFDTGKTGKHQLDRSQIRESTDGKGGCNKHTVWTVATQPYKEAHFATFPEDLIKPCIMAGSRLGDTVLDPFAGSGTTGKVAMGLGRASILIELNPTYLALAKARADITPGFL